MGRTTCRPASDGDLMSVASLSPSLHDQAMKAAIWAMPLVSYDALRQAYFRDSKAAYGDIIFWSKPATWKLQCLTPNTTVRYVFSFFNTAQSGPVVLEIPATGSAAINGTLIDA
jgi:hypothetical protein